MGITRAFPAAATAAVAAILAGAWTIPADALTRQQIIFQFDPTPADAANNDETRDDDSVDNGGSGDIPRDLVATIGAQNDRFFGSGSVGRFGDLGVQGRSSTVGELDTQVFIESDEFLNITGRPQQATANFIIDGGRVVMVAGEDSLVEFTLTIRKDFDVVFQTAFEYRAVNEFGTDNELLLFGTDIGITEITPNTVDIPFAFESADLGVIQPNEQFEISYQLDITATANVFAEIVLFEFSDPFNVSTDDAGDFPTVTFADVAGGAPSAAVPLPATAPLLLGAIGGLGFLARRRRTSADA